MPLPEDMAGKHRRHSMLLLLLLLLFEMPPRPISLWACESCGFGFVGDSRQGKVSMSLPLFFINHVRPLWRTQTHQRVFGSIDNRPPQSGWRVNAHFFPSRRSLSASWTTIITWGTFLWVCGIVSQMTAAIHRVNALETGYNREEHRDWWVYLRRLERGLSKYTTPIFLPV